MVLEEGHKRKVIFSTFDPDCATLLSLKCARYPVFFLTAAGSKHYADPRMNSLEAALIFAKSSKLQVWADPLPASAVWTVCRLVGMALHKKFITFSLSSMPEHLVNALLHLSLVNVQRTTFL